MNKNNTRCLLQQSKHEGQVKQLLIKTYLAHGYAHWKANAKPSTEYNGKLLLVKFSFFQCVLFTVLHRSFFKGPAVFIECLNIRKRDLY